MARSRGAGWVLLPVGHFAAKDVFGGPGQGGGIDADFEDVAAGGADADGRCAEESEACGDDGGGRDARAAGEGFGFDAAFEGADGQLGGARDLGEIDIGASRGEQGVAADEGAEGRHVEGGEIVDETDGVRNAGVEVVEDPGASVPGDGEVWAPILGRGEVDADGAGDDFGAEDAGGGFDEHVVGCGPEFACQSRDAAGPVAAHVGLGTVGVEEAHAEVGVGRGGLDQDDAFGADAAAPVAEAGDESGVAGGEGKVPVVEEEEIVAGAVHFPETEVHGGRMPWGGRQGKRAGGGRVRPCMGGVELDNGRKSRRETDTRCEY